MRKKKERRVTHSKFLKRTCFDKWSKFLFTASFPEQSITARAAMILRLISLICLSCIQYISCDGYLKREHSLAKPYTGIVYFSSIFLTLMYNNSLGQSRRCRFLLFFIFSISLTEGRWDFVGSTMVTNNYVRLTPDHQSRQGAIWNNIVRTSLIFRVLNRSK